MVSPYDNIIITGGSEERRKYIDGVICQFNKNYLHYLISYNKALKHRNSLLKQFAESNSIDKTTLEIWNEQLNNYGAIIYQHRFQFINDLIPVFQKYYSFISGEAEQVDLIYESQFSDNNFIQLLNQNLQKDLALGYTSAGLHKDDLGLNLSGYSIKKTGSQGQQKTYVVALKLAQFDFIKQINGYNPLILLDDIFDKLDPLRVEKILTLMADNHFGQIFITDKSKEGLKNILQNIKIEQIMFEVRNGKINKL
jgi:DNA replication and repair protein RecF